MRQDLHYSVRSVPGFNPRTHEECDRQDETSRSGYTKFQSTHSRGVRPRARVQAIEFFKFQSTHSRGVRLKLRDQYRAYGYVSIHALTRSATEYTAKADTVQKVSIHALTRSATQGNILRTELYREFQSTHSRGVRQDDADLIKQMSEFQSTHSRGVRLTKPEVPLQK